MSQHGYMRHMATPPLVLEIGQKLWHEAYNYTTYDFTGGRISHFPIDF